MFAIDLKTGELLYNYDIKSKIASEHPYGQWLKEHRIEIEENKNFTEETKCEEGMAL
jgi:glutamate synthase (ferredoxin)